MQTKKHATYLSLLALLALLARVVGNAVSVVVVLNGSHLRFCGRGVDDDGGAYWVVVLQRRGERNLFVRPPVSLRN